MAFVSETDDKQFKKTCDDMAKFKTVTRIWDLVTEEGQIELSEQQMKEISLVLAPKMHKAAIETEKTHVLLHENIRRLGNDLMCVSRTAESIKDTF
jgi:hypothetical protein